MVIIRESNASNLMNEEDEEEPGEVIESAPPLKVGEERTLGSSGIKKKLLKRGRGFELPDFGDEVTIKFVGCLLDGTRFAEADDRNYKVGSGEMVSGLDHGIVTMKKGEKALFTLPPELAYGEAGTNGVPPNSCIKFQVELISWIPVIDVSKDGGVIKRVVVKGEQTGKPCDLDQVLVKYVVTLADGTLLARTPEEGVEFYLNDGHLCPALPKAIKTMNRGEMVNLEVQPKYMSQGNRTIPPFLAGGGRKKSTPVSSSVPRAPASTSKSQDPPAHTSDARDPPHVSPTASPSKRSKHDGQQGGLSAFTSKNLKEGTVAQHLFASMGSKFAGKAETASWFKADPAKNADAVTKCLAEAFIRQASYTHNFKALEKKVAVLEFSKEQDKRSLVKTYKEELRRETALLRTDLKNAKKEKIDLEKQLKETLELATKTAEDTQAKHNAEITKLQGELDSARLELAGAEEKYLNQGVVAFMKGFIRKIPDFDWDKLGAGNAAYAAGLAVEIVAEDAEEARLEAGKLAEEARVAAEAEKANQDVPPP